MEKEVVLRREKTDLYRALLPVARRALDHYYDRTVTGIENIMPDGQSIGPAMYTPNHIVVADSPLIAVSYTEATDTPMRFGAKREYFDGKGLNDKGKHGRKVRWVMEHGLMIPVDRESKNARHFIELEKRSKRAFDRGDAVALHPEGTRSDDGKLHKFKRGAALIAINAGVPAVPVGVVYSSYSNERKTHVDIMFGEPIMPDEYQSGVYSQLSTKAKAEAITTALETRVADLTGMEQSGVFAVLKKMRHLRGSGETAE